MTPYSLGPASLDQGGVRKKNSMVIGTHPRTPSHSEKLRTANCSGKRLVLTFRGPNMQGS